MVWKMNNILISLCLNKECKYNDYGIKKGENSHA